jgi:hypothetical protein
MQSNKYYTFFKIVLYDNSYFEKWLNRIGMSDYFCDMPVNSSFLAGGDDSRNLQGSMLEDPCSFLSETLVSLPSRFLPGILWLCNHPGGLFTDADIPRGQATSESPYKDPISLLYHPLWFESI